MGLQHMVYAFSLIYQYDTTILLVYIGIAVFSKFVPNEPLLISYIVFVIACYRKICFHVVYLTGIGLRYFVIGYASIKRIEV